VEQAWGRIATSTAAAAAHPLAPCLGSAPPVGTTTYSCFGKTWTVTVPPQCSGSKGSGGGGGGCGLIVDIHGWNMDADMQDKNSGMRAAGAAHGYAVLQPTACCVAPATSWNMSAGSADPDQIMAVATELGALLALDARRRHCTGFSQGGYMTWAMLGRFPDAWAAVAPTAAGNGWPAATRPVPVLYQQGVHDGLVPIASGRAAIAALRAAGGLDAEAAVASGAGFNHSRFTSSRAGAPGVVEFVQHAYVGSPVGPLPIWGHCFAGSVDVPAGVAGALLAGQIMNFGCPFEAGEQAGYSYSDTVIAFFVAHPKPAVSTSASSLSSSPPLRSTEESLA
jgi:polyhydroxybutyrate depolymerase